MANNTSHSGRNRRPSVQILRFHSGPIRQPHLLLLWLKTANSIVRKLITYHSYRLKQTPHMRSSTETTEIRIYINSLNLSISNHTFNGPTHSRVWIFNSFHKRGGHTCYVPSTSLRFFTYIASQHGQSLVSNQAHRRLTTRWCHVLAENYSIILAYLHNTNINSRSISQPSIHSLTRRRGGRKLPQEIYRS